LTPARRGAASNFAISTGPRIARIVVIGLCWASQAAGGTPGSTRPKTPPDSLGRVPETWLAHGTRGDWKLVLGAASSDTLTTSCDVALSSAEEALKSDDWIIDPYDRSRGAFATRWKPIRNVLFRLFAGGAMARCFVTVRPIRSDRTAITFQGGIASRRDLSHNAMRPLAERSYRAAVRVWIREVRQGVARRQGRRVTADLSR
jgi:hypothetical protein